MERKSFVFYASWLDAVENLPKEMQGDALLAIVRYGARGEEAADMKPVAKAMLVMVKAQIDANNARYRAGMKGAEFGRLGGRPRKNPCETPQKPQENPKETPCEPLMNMNMKNENVKGEKGVLTHTPKEGVAVKAKVEVAPSVLLTEAERDKFVADYGEQGAQELFAILSDYKLSKGKAYKNDAAAIRSWVVDRWLERRGARTADAKRRIEDARNGSRSETLKNMGFDVV